MKVVKVCLPAQVLTEEWISWDSVVAPEDKSGLFQCGHRLAERSPAEGAGFGGAGAGPRSGVGRGGDAAGIGDTPEDGKGTGPRRWRTRSAGARATVLASRVTRLR